MNVCIASVGVDEPGRTTGDGRPFDVALGLLLLLPSKLPGPVETSPVSRESAADSCRAEEQGDEECASCRG